MSKKLKALEDWFDDLIILLAKFPDIKGNLKQALTPPTEEEIVKELQSWFVGRRFLYIGSNPVTKYFESTDEEVCVIFRRGNIVIENNIYR